MKKGSNRPVTNNLVEWCPTLGKARPKRDCLSCKRLAGFTLTTVMCAHK